MKALLYNPQASAKVIVGERPAPEPKEHEVVVQVRAVSLNHRDLLLIKGELFDVTDPMIVGSDGAGVIHAVGSQVTKWRVGDEVTWNPGYGCGSCYHCLRGEQPNCANHCALGGPEDGVIAQFAVIQEEYLIAKPTYLSFQEAAALPMALGTAWRSLVVKGRLQHGETVLIQGIGGGVAYLAMQVAVHLGANVIVTSSSQEKLNIALKAGAQAGIHYPSEDVAERVMELTQGVGVQVSLETGGRETFPTTLATLAHGGRVIGVGAVTGPGVGATPLSALLSKELDFIIGQMPSQTDLEDAFSFYEQHRLIPSITQGYTLLRAPEAIADYVQSKQLGKMVLGVDPEGN